MSHDLSEVSEILKTHYEKRFDEFGCSSEGVDWGSNAQAVEVRHEVMARVIKKSSASILDVGCGYGAFYDHIKNLHNVRYTGIDLVPEMIKEAAKRSPEADFIAGDVFETDLDTYDYVVCNGILTQKLTATNSEMNSYMKKLVRRMFDLAADAVAFNVMKSKVNFFSENLFYKSPAELLPWIMEEITDRFIVDHSYPLYEYTVYLFKGENSFQ